MIVFSTFRDYSLLEVLWNANSIYSDSSAGFKSFVFEFTKKVRGCVEVISVYVISLSLKS